MHDAAIPDQLADHPARAGIYRQGWLDKSASSESPCMRRDLPCPWERVLGWYSGHPAHAGIFLRLRWRQGLFIALPCIRRDSHTNCRPHRALYKNSFLHRKMKSHEPEAYTSGSNRRCYQDGQSSRPTDEERNIIQRDPLNPQSIGFVKITAGTRVHIECLTPLYVLDRHRPELLSHQEDVTVEAS